MCGARRVCGARRGVGGPKGCGGPEGVWGARRGVGGLKGCGGAEGVWGVRRVGGPKFRAFFLSPAGNFILSSLSGGSSRGILVVFEALGRSNVRVWSSRAVV